MKINQDHEILIKSKEQFKQILEAGIPSIPCTIQNIDLSEWEQDMERMPLDHLTFLGCTLTPEQEQYVRTHGACVYPIRKGLPYNPYRHNLYSWQELMEGYTPDDDQSIDLKIYEHFSESRFNPDINEALNQRIHDHAIDDCLRDLLKFDANGMTERKCVGFMGGHGVKRDHPDFIRTAKTARMMAQSGYFVVSGGGPGIMEATNLGAWFAPYSESDLEAAIDILKEAPHYSDHNFTSKAMEVLERFPQGGESLAIPTWFYGHEPSNLFSTHIAKYFSNSIREDNLLAICLYGVVFAPGSAGTTQEIFQDAAQNHYATYGYISPMVFMGKKRYTEETHLFPVLNELASGKTYQKLLYLSDSPEEIVAFIQQHPPIKHA